MVDVDAVLQGRDWSASRPRTATALAAVLRNRIALGGLPPGTRLPTERELAASLGVSRNTVREALRRLADDGLVTTTLGRSGGTRVREVPPGHPSRAEIAAGFRRTIEEYMQYRAAIEPLAARLAARHAEPDEVRELVSLLREPAPDLATYHRLDSRLHASIARASRNSVLGEAVERAREEMFVRGNVLWLRTNWSAVYAGDDAVRAAFGSEHRKIVAAIETADADAAEEAMHRHLAEARAQFLRLLDDTAEHD